MLTQVYVSPDDVEAGRVQALGFAKFNRCPHLCLEIPDGGLTVSCRTSEGHTVTFAFCPYKSGGPPQCVDIQRHDAAETVPNGDRAVPVQRVICRGIGPVRYVSPDGQPDKAVTLTVLLLTNREETQS